jgi:hypothetical protein
MGHDVNIGALKEEFREVRDGLKEILFEIRIYLTGALAPTPNDTFAGPPDDAVYRKEEYAPPAPPIRAGVNLQANLIKSLPDHTTGEIIEDLNELKNIIHEWQWD